MNIFLSLTNFYIRKKMHTKKYSLKMRPSSNVDEQSFCVHVIDFVGWFRYQISATLNISSRTDKISTCIGSAIARLGSRFPRYAAAFPRSYWLRVFRSGKVDIFLNIFKIDRIYCGTSVGRKILFFSISEIENRKGSSVSKSQKSKFPPKTDCNVRRLMMICAKIPKFKQKIC